MVKVLRDTLLGHDTKRIPFWFMRQAGRYLPEYLAYRKSFNSFLDMCFSPQAIEEITLMPLKRFDLDAVILFSDILVIPYALGQNVTFNEGPVLEKADFSAFSPQTVCHKLSPTLEGIERIKKSLSPELTFIGFCGAPWTLATYMIEGGSSKDFLKTFRFALTERDNFTTLLQTLAESCALFLSEQVKAGVEVIQIFDTWAGAVPDSVFETWVLAPMKRLLTRFRETHPKIPVIYFPKGCGNHLELIIKSLDIQGVSLDSTLALSHISHLQNHIVTQGNLDPRLLLVGGDEFEKNLRELKDIAKHRHIFNLGHGILPETPLSHVEEMVRVIRA